MKGKSSLRADDTIALENAPDLVNENLLRWACATRKKNDVKRAKKPGREIAKIECLFTNAFPTKGTINSLYPTMVFFVCFDGSWKGDRKSVSKTGHLCKTYLTHDRMIFFYRGSLLPFFFFFINRFETFIRRVEIYWSLRSSFEFEKDGKKKKMAKIKVTMEWSKAREEDGEKAEGRKISDAIDR